MPKLNVLLDWLAESEFTWSIITSKPRITYEVIEKNFNLKPKTAICGDDVKQGKPQTEAAFRLCSNLKIDASNVIYVGDTIHDHLFAINAGFEFVCFADKINKETLNLYKNIELRARILNQFPCICSLEELHGVIRSNFNE